MFGYTYIINYNGEEETETAKSNDTSIQFAEVNACALETGETEFRDYAVELSEGADHAIALPETPSDSNIMLGIKPKDQAATWKLADESLQKGEAVGHYRCVDASALADGSELKVIVTAEDGTKQEHTFRISRKSSACDLTDLRADGGTLKESVQPDTYLYHIEKGNASQVKLTAVMSAGASLLADNKVCENGEVTITDFHDRTCLTVQAVDGITKQNYYILFEEDEKSPFYGLTDEAKAEAAAILDEGWNKRSDREKRDMTDGYWSVFKADDANPTPDKNALDNAVVYDITRHKYNQQTDWAAVVLQLIIMGENPYDYNGVDYVDGLQKAKNAGFANNLWRLAALRAAGEEPEPELIEAVCRQATPRTNVDMSAWALATARDYMSEWEAFQAVEVFRNRLITKEKQTLDGITFEDANIGIFKSPDYRNANITSHGCALTGLAAANVNITGIFDASFDGVDRNPINAIRNYMPGNGGFSYEIGFTGAYDDNVVMALGEIAYGNGETMYSKHALTEAQYTELLDIANGIDKESIQDADKKGALEAALQDAAASGQPKVQELPGKPGVKFVVGSGKEYWTLYGAVAAIDPALVNKPETRMCTMEESDQVDAINAVSEKLDPDATAPDFANVAAITTAYESYQALGGEDDAAKTKLQGYVKNAEALETAYGLLQSEESQKISEVIFAIANLPDTATLSIAGPVNEARGLYNALTPEQQANVGAGNVAKLNRLTSEIQTLQNGVNTVNSLIAALPAADQANLTDEEKAAVQAAQNAYDNLTNEQKGYVNGKDKLEALQRKIADQAEAKRAFDLIAALGEITQDNWKEKEPEATAAQAAYDRLTDAQKALIPESLEALTKAKEAIDAFKLAEKEKAVKEAMELINELAMDENGAPVSGELTAEWIVRIRAIRDKVNALTPEDQSKIENLAKLELAEAYISQSALADAQAKLEALPDSSRVEEGAEPLTQEEIDAIMAAQAAYEKLNPDLQELIDPALTDRLALLFGKAMESLEGQEAYVKDYAQELTLLWGKYGQAGALKRDALGEVKRTVEKYDRYAQCGEALDGQLAEGQSAQAMIDFLNVEIQRVEKAIADAAAMDAQIAGWEPTEINADNAEAIKADVGALKAEIAGMTEEAKGYMNSLGRLDAVEAKLAAWEKSVFQNGKPELIEAKAGTNGQIVVTWKPCGGAAEYRIYRKAAGQADWGQPIGTADGQSYTDKAAKAGTTYYYTVSAVSGQWPDVTSAYDAIGVKAAAMAKPSIKTAASASYQSVKITWSAVKGASRYEIYRAASKNGKYKKVGEASGKSFIDSKLKTGTAYYYKVRAYNTVGKSKAYSAFSAPKAAKPTLGKAQLAKAESAKKAVRLTWKKVSGASGYTIYRATSKNGKYKAVKTLRGSSLSYKDAKLKNGKKYYYKVRAYRTVNKKKVYGAYSAAKAAKAK